MDEQALNELLECSVCLDQLDDTSKVLPCQHTFCKRCLEEIVSTKHELRCPECRFLVSFPTIHNSNHSAPLAPQCCGFESRLGLGFFHLRKLSS